MFTKKNTFICLFLFGFFITFSQEKPSEIVERFFKNYEEKGSTFALDNLYGPNKWISRSSDAISTLKNQLEGLNKDYVGEYHGKEVLIEKKLSDSYVLISYMVKFDRQPIRFTFQFYKPDTTWRIQSFSFDGDLDNEIEESAKLYRFRLN